MGELLQFIPQESYATDGVLPLDLNALPVQKDNVIFLEKKRQRLEVRNMPLAYDPYLDMDEYSKAEIAEKERLNLYTKQQLETHVGERLNVLLSTVRYNIKDGHLYGENANEPAIEMFARGVGRDGSTAEDLAREKAELFGFAQTDADLSSLNTRIGKKRLSVSPPSGSYQHNFYDIFTLKEDEEGRYVEMRRYSSGLDINQTASMLKGAGLADEDYQANPEYTLSHPIEIATDNFQFKTADDIHKYLHASHEYASQEEYTQIVKICMPLITSYVNTLANNPYDVRSILLNYNALLVQVDIAWDAIKNNDQRMIQVLLDRAESYSLTAQDIEIMGMQKARMMMIGCGASGLFSVADKGLNMTSEKTKLCCTCPFCSQKVEAEIGGGTIKCPSCKRTAPYSKQQRAA
jgi:hypothetical protein